MLLVIRLLPLLACAALFAACGEDPDSGTPLQSLSGRDVLLHACKQSDGTVPELCDCVVKVMEEEFTEGEFALLVQAARENPELTARVDGISEQTMTRVLMTAFNACNQ